MRPLQKLTMIVAMAALAVAVESGTAAADKLDDIIASGKLRCGVMLDFPPIGFRDAKNEPVGYDVDFCVDMAKALGVEPMIVETPSPDRIPALVSNRVDVSIASASNTLERAKTVAFSIPYIIYTDVVVTKAGTGITSFEDLKGKHVGGVRGTTPEQKFLVFFKEWNDSNGKYTPYQSDADQYLALAQGKIDAFITVATTAAELRKTDQYKTFVVAGQAPFTLDVCAIMVNRQDHGFLRWVNLFVYEQARVGRYDELYRKWVGSEPPSLSLPNVYY